MLRDSFRNWLLVTLVHSSIQFHTVPHPHVEVLEPRYLRWLLPKSWAIAMGSKSPVGCGSIVDPVAFYLLIVWKVMVIDDWWSIVGDWWLIIGDWWWLMVVVWKNVWLVGLPANLSWQDLTYSLHAQWCSHYTTVQTFAIICIHMHRVWRCGFFGCKSCAKQGSVWRTKRDVIQRRWCKCNAREF